MTYAKSTTKKISNHDNSHKTQKPHHMKASSSGHHASAHDGLDLKALGYKDQFNDDWVCVQKNGKKAFSRLDTFMTNQAQFYVDLKNGGVLITDPKVKSQMGRLIDNKSDSERKVHVARHAGWHDDCFIKPDHSIIGKPPKRFVPDQANRPVHLARKGTFEGWSSAVKTFAEGQSTLTVVLCLSYLGPLLQFMESGNFGLDLTGTSSIGKSKALDLAASVWGAPLGMPGSIAASLRTTDNAAEQLMMSRANALLALDEVNLLGIDTRKQAEGVSNLAFLLGEGTEKNRRDNLASSPADLVFMVTSNKPVVDLMRMYERSNAEAATVRLITVTADAGAGYGVFDHLPPGYDSSGKAVLALRAALADNHGHSIDIFLNRLVDSVKRDRVGILARIMRDQQDFIERAGVSADDGMAYRRALAFAAIYAAGRLAKHFGALPLGNIGKSVMTCYGRSLAAISGTTAIERVQAYLVANTGQLYDLDDLPRRKLSDDKLDLHPGFLKRRKGRRCLMMRTERWESEFGNDANTILAELNAAGLLQTTDGRQLQTKVRKNSEKDRVYAVIID